MLQFFSDQGPKSKEVSSERVPTEESKSTDEKEEETYIIVRKQKDFNGDPKGYKLGRLHLIQSLDRPSNWAGSISLSARSSSTGKLKPRPQTPSTN